MRLISSLYKARINRLPFFTAQFLAVIVSLSAQAAPTTYYVSTTGSDSNPGTLNAPFKTIAKGSRALASGDTLLVRAGTYDERMMTGYDGFVFQNGTSSAYTRYAAYPGEKVIIKPSQGGFVVWFSRTRAYVELKGFILDGTNVEHNIIKIDASADQHAIQIRVVNNEIKNNKTVAVLSKGPQQFIGNHIHHSKSYGMYISGNNGLIEGNVVHDNGGYGLHLFDQNYPVNGWVVRNNVFYANGDGYYPRYEPYNGVNKRPLPGVILTRGKNQFYNNIVFNHVNGGVSVYGGSDRTLVANNTVYGNGNYGIGIHGSNVINTRVVNNIVWKNGGSQITDSGTNSTIQNNLTVNPLFVNPTVGDFGVQAGSPALDKGTTLTEVLTDFTGQKRPSGAYDMGAFEGSGSRAGAVPGIGGEKPSLPLAPRDFNVD